MSYYVNAFPNPYRGQGQPDFMGTDADGRHKIAIWMKKDKRGREYPCVKVDDLEPENSPVSPGDDDEYPV